MGLGEVASLAGGGPTSVYHLYGTQEPRVHYVGQMLKFPAGFVVTLPLKAQYNLDLSSEL